MLRGRVSLRASTRQYRQAHTPGGTDRLAKRMHNHSNLFLQPELADKASTFGAQEPNAVRLIKHELNAALVVLKDVLGSFDEFLQRTDIAVHAVYRLDRNEDGPLPLAQQRARSQEVPQRVPECVNIAMREGDPVRRQRLSHAVVGTRMDQRVVHNDVPLLWDRGPDG